MNLTLNQFEVLTFIEREQENKLTQRDIAKGVNFSLGLVHTTLQEITELELIKPFEDSKYTVTLKGYEWLEPYKVKRAIFMAAGFGSRMVPVTLNTPKPLIKVHGKRIIETLLDAVLAVGITDIILVRGYLGEQFDLLLKKYPMIKFVENYLYNEANSISSAYVVRDKYRNSYVFDSDLVLYNPNIVRKYEYTSNYIGFETKLTDDWCFETKKGFVTKVKIGGENVYQMVGVSYWTKEDGEKLEKDIEKVFTSPGGKERYWDEVALTNCKKNYKVWVRPIHREDIIEIDTYNELKQIDPIYNV